MTAKKKTVKTTSLKIISVIMAVLLWIYIGSQGESSARQNYLETRLNYYHLGSGLTVSGPETVTVRLWGNYQPDAQIQAYVELNGLGAGDHELPVRVQQIKGAMLTSVQPQRVKVHISQTRSRQLPIIGEVVQNPPAGYEVLDLVPVPNRCIVSGEQQQVQQVARVVCPVSLGAVTATTSMQSALVAQDSRGNAISGGIELTPARVEINVAVGQKLDHKEVNLKAIVQGTPAPGYHLKEAALDPATVTLIGSKERLTAINEIGTAPINVDGKNASFTQDVKVQSLDNIRVYPSQVLAEVAIEKDSDQGETHNADTRPRITPEP